MVAGSALINSVLTSSNPLLRCAAGECLGRIAQVSERGGKYFYFSVSIFPLFSFSHVVNPSLMLHLLQFPDCSALHYIMLMSDATLHCNMFT